MLTNLLLLLWGVGDGGGVGTGGDDGGQGIANRVVVAGMLLRGYARRAGCLHRATRCQELMMRSASFGRGAVHHIACITITSLVGGVLGRAAPTDMNRTITASYCLAATAKGTHEVVRSTLPLALGGSGVAVIKCIAGSTDHSGGILLLLLETVTACSSSYTTTVITPIR